MNDIKKAQKLPSEPNLKPNQKPDVSHYEVYRGNLGDHYIENLKRGQRRYYITKDTLDHSIPTTSRGAIESANNIIPSFLSNFNLPKWVNSQTTFVANTINSKIDNNTDKNKGGVFTIRAQKNEFLPNYKYNNSDVAKIFAPEEIGSMSAEEFAQQENEIMNQVKQGLINQTNHQKQDFTGYKNPVSGDNRIFSQEDIGNFSTDEFTEHEKEIHSQWGTIGIPTNSELQSSGAIYIAPYTRSDGVQVKGHYRAR